MKNIKNDEIGWKNDAASRFATPHLIGLVVVIMFCVPTSLEDVS